MKVALFATCLVDTLAPQVAHATATLLQRLGHEVVVPAGQSCCGQMHVNTGYRREAVPIVANHVRAFAGAEAIVAPSGSCVASIHHQQAAVARRAGEHALADEAAAAGRAHLRAVPVPGRRPRRHRRRRVLPAPGHLPPDLPLTADAAGRRPAAAAAARRPRPGAGGAARRRPVLRLRRHVRGEERRHVDGDAHRQDGQRAVDARRGLHRRRRVLPAAHRRRAVAAARGHPHGAPGRDPRLDGGGRDASAHRGPEPRPRGLGDDRRLPRHPDGAARGRAPARRRVVPRRRPRGAARRAAPREPRPRHLDHPRQAGAASSARCPTGRSCARPAARSRPPRWPGSTST